MLNKLRGEFKMANFELLQESVIDHLYCEGEAYVTEGTNSDISKKYKEVVKKYKDCMADIKKDFKAKEYESAVKKCDDLMKYIDDMESIIDSKYDDVGSVVWGYIIQGFATSVKAMILGIPTFGIGSAVVYIKDTIDIISGMIAEYKKKEDFSLEMFNQRRAKIIGCVKSLKKAVDHLKMDIESAAKEEKAKEEKKEEPVKESTSDSLKLEIFESCYNGDISEDERDVLLNLL